MPPPSAPPPFTRHPTDDPPPHETLEWPRRLVVFAFLGLSVWYLGWRAGTLNPEAPFFSALLYGCELFGFATASLHIFMTWRLTVRRAPPPRPGLTVDVFVPTYNEPVELVRRTLLAARDMAYPHETWLLDDGRRDAMRALAQELGVRYLTRPDNEHAKAGNLNHALTHAHGDFVAIFDADHAPRRDFLLKTLGYFDDARVAFVQTPQDFYNLDSYQHRRARHRQDRIWTEQALFFRVIQRGKDWWNSAFFCGSCAIARRSALDDIGGFATGTVTEDLHTSLKLHARGHRSVYHAEPLAFGIAPESVEPFLSQRIRWGQGAMHVWRMEGILTKKGLTLAQRLNYFASAVTYFDGWQKGVFYVAPVIVLLTGTMPIVTSTPEFLLHFLPYYAFTFWVFEEVGRGYGRTLLTEQYNLARFAAFAWATLAWVLPRRWLRFKVTKKGLLSDGTLRHTLAQRAVLGLNLVAVPLGLWFFWLWGWLPVEGVVANSIWAGVNAAMALAVLAFTRRNAASERREYRFPVPLPAEFIVDGEVVRGTVAELSVGGLRFNGPLPAGVQRGSPVSGRLLLPDGPLPLRGEVKAVVRRDADGLPTAVGCAVDCAHGDRLRLEGFLFGSDLQWTVNDLSDRVHTPLSRWMPRTVDGPRPGVLSEQRWTGGTLRSPAVPGMTPFMVLHARPAAVADAPEPPAAAGPGAAQAAGGELLLSFAALPVGVPLLLDLAARRSAAPRAVMLSPLESVSLPPGLHLYRLQPLAAARPVPQRLPPALPADEPQRTDFSRPDFVDTDT